MKTNIAIFASGKGSNADNICKYFKNHPSVQIALIVSDRKEAGVFDIAEKHHVPSLHINKAGWTDTTFLLQSLKELHIDFIVLAGFLKLIPPSLIAHFPGKIINIHPALLPSYGGAGMYGHYVHEAVHAAGETETGITIHYVDEHYDKGDVIFQARVALNRSDTPEDIAARIHTLEMKHFPSVIESLISSKI